MNDEQHDRAVRLLYKYKFENRSLERTLIDLFEIGSIRDSCLYKTALIPVIKQLTFELVDYKFNQSNMSKLELIDFIDNWMQENVDILNDTRYSMSEFTFD